VTRRINEINVHCSATRPDWFAGKTAAAKVKEIKRWHVEQNGWGDIGYHYLIDRDGEIVEGRPVQRTGAFEPKVNATAIGVCLLGGYGAAATDVFEKHFTPEQDAALRTLIEQLQDEQPGIAKVTGHNDYSSKGCPGFKVDRWLAHKPPRTFAQSGTAVGAGTATIAAGGMAVEQVVQTLAETRGAVEEAQRVQAGAVGSFDVVRAVLIVVILAAAGYALWRRWQDWKAGRK
jgi:N-acetylmuramoyl-L-alanine amidase